MSNWHISSMPDPFLSTTKTRLTPLSRSSLMKASSPRLTVPPLGAPLPSLWKNQAVAYGLWPITQATLHTILLTHSPLPKMSSLALIPLQPSMPRTMLSATIFKFLCPRRPATMYQYLWDPMGLGSSSDEFCHHSDVIFSRIPGIGKLVNDILIKGRDLEDLEDKLKLCKVFWHCSTHGFVLSDKKFEINTSVEFAGYIVSSTSVKPSPKSLEAIEDFPIPTDVTAVWSFLGLCNQLRHFIPNHSSFTHVLNDLLKKGITFCWLPNHDGTFNAIKKSLVTTLSLHHFDAGLLTRLITDASHLHGLGYALVQTKSETEFQPICILQCGSCLLNSTECNYFTIELECLGIQWALKKCNHFLRGLHDFDVLTDHHPLIGLMSWWGYVKPHPCMLLRSSGSLAKAMGLRTPLATILLVPHHCWRLPLRCLATPPSLTCWNQQLLPAPSTARSAMQSLPAWTPTTFWTIIPQGSCLPFGQLLWHQRWPSLHWCQAAYCPSFMPSWCAGNPPHLTSWHRSNVLHHPQPLLPGLKNYISAIINKCDPCQHF